MAEKNENTERNEKEEISYEDIHASACTIKGTDTDGKGSGTIIR